MQKALHIPGLLRPQGPQTSSLHYVALPLSDLSSEMGDLNAASLSDGKKDPRATPGTVRVEVNRKISVWVFLLLDEAR